MMIMNYDYYYKVSSVEQLPVPFLSAHDLISISYRFELPVFSPKLIAIRDFSNFTPGRVLSMSELKVSSERETSCTKLS